MTTTTHSGHYVASVESDCDIVQDAVLALQAAKNVSLSAIVKQQPLPSLVDQMTQIPQTSISRFFNISPGYTLPEYVEEDYVMAMYVRNALIVLALLAFAALAIKLCCSHGYWHRAQRKYNDKVALDYRMQVAQLRAESLASDMLEK